MCDKETFYGFVTRSMEQGTACGAEVCDPFFHGGDRRAVIGSQTIDTEKTPGTAVHHLFV